ncbi:MAG TPA: hypothetical protein VF779_02640 [Pyrinomonadaceae bacterium]
MKHRRSTIIVAIMVALVGTPRVWKEFGNILASLQHKTQNKLLSMAVNSQVHEGDTQEIAAMPQSEHMASTCPYEKFSQVAINRKSVNTSAPRKVKVERIARPSSDELSTLAANAASKMGHDVKLPRPEETMAWVGENKLIIHDIASVPREMQEPSNVTEFVAVPKINTIPTVFIEKNADLIKLKKSLEETKALRQRVRYVFTAKNLPVPPST